MTGGRPRLTREAILEAGLELGMENLSIAAVAQRLEVTRTSVHRHVGSRYGLETLVGEHLVSAAPPVPDVGGPLEEHMLRFAEAMCAFVRATPGIAEYYARGFPRTERSARVVDAFAATLVARGLGPPQALRLAAGVANCAVALTSFWITHEAHLAAAPAREWDPAALPVFAAVASAEPDAVGWERWMLRAAVAGLVRDAADPGEVG